MGLINNVTDSSGAVEDCLCKFRGNEEVTQSEAPDMTLSQLVSTIAWLVNEVQELKRKVDGKL